MHHYECVALCKDISIQIGRFCARSLPSYILRSSEDRSSIINVLHPSCARPPRWSPPVLWKRFKDVLASICVLIHLCKMPKESERTDLMMDESGGWLVMRWCRHFWKSRANECPGFFVGTMVHCINLLYICLVYLLYICLDPYIIIGSLKTLYRWSFFRLVRYTWPPQVSVRTELLGNLAKCLRNLLNMVADSWSSARVNTKLTRMGRDKNNWYRDGWGWTTKCMGAGGDRCKRCRKGT